VLRRAGYSDEFISDVLSQLPDPIDLQRDQQMLARYGLSPAWEAVLDGPTGLLRRLARLTQAGSSGGKPMAGVELRGEIPIQIARLPLGRAPHRCRSTGW
jgi:hypothetical protein